MTFHLLRLSLLLAAAGLAVFPAELRSAQEILNVSYDVSREFYKDYDRAFAAHWLEKTGHDLTINVSHGGSSKQARSVADGLEADVVTMNQETDINLLVRARLVEADWRGKFPDNSSPYVSTILFLVRKDNPKAIKDWSDLVHPGVEVIVPNPKTSGNGRYSYLAAWAWAAAQPGGSAKSAKAFVEQLFKRVPVLDTGGRAATTTFIERGIGDVLLTFESEIEQITRHFHPGQFEVVVPSLSVEAEFPVAVVDKYAERRGTRAVAAEYLSYLWSPEGQNIAVRHGYRPRAKVEGADKFPALRLVTVDEAFEGWSTAQRVHFDDGGLYDDITTAEVLKSQE
jgi:sulfate transport system substrate-binding protein